MTRVRVLTPSGRGAIAVVEVTGPDAAVAVDRWFAGRAPLAGAPIDAVRFGRWRRDGEAARGEEIVAVRTANDRVEVHCHGGVAASTAIIAALVDGGAAEDHAAGPDPVRQELSLAPTERTAGILLDQANGALAEVVTSALTALAAGDPSRAASELRGALRYERLGSRLMSPWRVVIAGPPNVGKSSLINALVGYERAIVYDLPGTTRDVVTAATAIAGWPVTLADTAGVRETNDVLEAAGVELARQTLGAADVVVVVREAATIGSEESAAVRSRLLADAPPHAAVVDVASKIDLAPSVAGTSAGHEPSEGLLLTNAPRGVGVAETLAAIERAFGIDPPAPGTAVPLGGQSDILRAALAALSADKLDEAEMALRALLAGEKA